MFSANIVKFAVLAALALPLSVLAANHGQLLNRRQHTEFVKRASGDKDIDSNSTLSARDAGSRWSFYDVETGAAGSCGSFHRNSDFTVAMNVAQMNPSLCYKTIVMTYNGRTTTADISDTCPGCPYNGLDLTEGLFGFFTDMGSGIIYGDWEFADAAPAPPPTQPAWTPAPPPPPPPPPTTSVWVPPTTTSSSTPVVRPTSSSVVVPSSSSRPVSSSSVPSSSVSVGSVSSSGASAPAPSALDQSSTPSNSNNLEGINLAFVQLGGMYVSGNKLT